MATDMQRLNSSLNGTTSQINGLLLQTMNITTQINTINQSIFKDVNYTNPFNHMYLPNGALIYDSISDYLSSPYIDVSKSTISYNSYYSTKYYGRYMVGFTKLYVHVPLGYNVLWIRAGIENNYYKVISNNASDTLVANYQCSGQFYGHYSPEGGEIDFFLWYHKWCPIPLYFSGDYIITTSTTTPQYISGFAFSTNPWNHAKNVFE